MYNIDTVKRSLNEYDNNNNNNNNTTCTSEKCKLKQMLASNGTVHSFSCSCNNNNNNNNKTTKTKTATATNHDPFEELDFVDFHKSEKSTYRVVRDVSDVEYDYRGYDTESSDDDDDDDECSILSPFDFNEYELSSSIDDDRMDEHVEVDNNSRMTFNLNNSIISSCTYRGVRFSTVTVREYVSIVVTEDNCHENEYDIVEYYKCLDWDYSKEFCHSIDDYELLQQIAKAERRIHYNNNNSMSPSYVDANKEYKCDKAPLVPVRRRIIDSETNVSL